MSTVSPRQMFMMPSHVTSSGLQVLFAVVVEGTAEQTGITKGKLAPDHRTSTSSALQNNGSSHLLQAAYNPPSLA